MELLYQRGVKRVFYTVGRPTLRYRGAAHCSTRVNNDHFYRYFKGSRVVRVSYDSLGLNDESDDDNEYALHTIVAHCEVWIRTLTQSDFIVACCLTRELQECIAVGDDGKEISTSTNFVDELCKFEKVNTEGWWMEKVEDLKEKMERILNFDLSR